MGKKGKKVKKDTSFPMIGLGIIKPYVIMYRGLEYDIPIGITNNEIDAACLADRANETYNEFVPESNPFYVSNAIQLSLSQPTYISECLSCMPVPVTVKFKSSKYISMDVDETYLQLLAQGNNTNLPDKYPLYAVPHLVRAYDDNTVVLKFMFKPTHTIDSDEHPLRPMLKKQVATILKRFEKSGITPKQLAAVEKDKLLRVAHSTFQGKELNVFTTNKNRSKWLKLNNLTADD